MLNNYDNICSWLDDAVIFMNTYFVSIRTSPYQGDKRKYVVSGYNLESSSHILGFLKLEITNLRSEFHHLERASIRTYALYK